MMPSKELEDIFYNLSPWGNFYERFYSPESWRNANVLAGARLFKKKALGFLSSSRVMSPQEVAELLFELEGASSIDEGKKMISCFANQKVNYTSGSYLQFTLVKDSKGQEFYRIEKGEGKVQSR
jgi:hypothetical protein